MNQTTTADEIITDALNLLYAKRENILSNADASYFEDLKLIEDIENYEKYTAQIKYIISRKHRLESVRGDLLQYINNSL